MKPSRTKGNVPIWPRSVRLDRDAWMLSVLIGYSCLAGACACMCTQFHLEELYKRERFYSCSSTCFVPIGCQICVLHSRLFVFNADLHLWQASLSRSDPQSGEKREKTFQACKHMETFSNPPLSSTPNFSYNPPLFPILHPSQLVDTSKTPQDQLAPGPIIE